VPVVSPQCTLTDNPDTTATAAGNSSILLWTRTLIILTATNPKMGLLLNYNMVGNSYLKQESSLELQVLRIEEKSWRP
jgi:hypothetical protein